MKVLVTGSTGFIGANLCHALTQQNYDVVAFHRQNSPLSLLEGLPVEHRIGDITDPASLNDAMQGIEIVFHAAAQLKSPKNLNNFNDVTISGSRNVLEAAINHRVERFIHTSSVAALGVPLDQDANKTRLMDENHTWNFSPDRWIYGYSKYMAEMEVQKAITRGLDAVIVNPSVVIGPRDINLISGNVLLHTAKRHFPIAVSGGINAVHVDDVISGHIAAMNHGITGERYILGGENISILEFLKIISGVCAVPPPFFVVPGKIIRILAPILSILQKLLPLPGSISTLHKAGYFFYYNTQKSKDHLYLKHARPISEAVTDAYRWYQQHGYI
jgi:dihydroflavonol-4-reductase